MNYAKSNAAKEYGVERAKFRQRFHYYGFLKNWEENYHTLDFLDNKTTGLLTISALLTASFVVLIELGGEDEAFVIWLKLIAVSGLIVVIISAYYALKCYRILSDRNKTGRLKILQDLESAIAPRTDKWRAHEHRIDMLLHLFDKVTRSEGEEEERHRQRLVSRYDELSSGSFTFEEFEEKVFEFFDALREEVEEEILDRHRWHRYSRNGILIALFLMAVIAFSFLQSVGSQIFSS